MQASKMMIMKTLMTSMNMISMKTSCQTTSSMMSLISTSDSAILRMVMQMKLLNNLWPNVERVILKRKNIKSAKIFGSSLSEKLLK